MCPLARTSMRRFTSSLHQVNPRLIFWGVGGCRCHSAVPQYTWQPADTRHKENPCEGVSALAHFTIIERQHKMHLPPPQKWFLNKSCISGAKQSGPGVEASPFCPNLPACLWWTGLNQEVPIQFTALAGRCSACTRLLAHFCYLLRSCSTLYAADMDTISLWVCQMVQVTGPTHLSTSAWYFFYFYCPTTL